MRCRSCIRRTASWRSVPATRTCGLPPWASCFIASTGRVRARRFPSWIGKGLALEIRFRNGTYRTQPVTAASVKGKHEDGSRWSYEVF